jgi:hypothetical protein
MMTTDGAPPLVHFTAHQSKQHNTLATSVPGLASRIAFVWDFVLPRHQMRRHVPALAYL